MKRRILALFLALVMAVGLVMPASAEGLGGTTTIGGAGESVVITGDGVTTTPTTGDSAPTPGDSTPTPGDSTPTPGDSTPTTGDSTTTPPTTTPPAAPVDGVDEDESDTPTPLLGMAPLSGDTPVAPAAVTTASNVAYQDENGDEQTCTSATVVESTTTTWGTEGTGTWYVVNSDVTINDTVTVTENSDVYLILADDATLTVNGKRMMSDADTTGGIYVKGSLTIYAQSEGTGKLTAGAEAVSKDFSFGIYIGSASLSGASKPVRAGSLTVNGGVINATGGVIEDANHPNNSSYGIGADGNVTINGGTVTATGGTISSSDTGKDGESYGIIISSGVTVTVYGGKLAAIGGMADKSNMISQGIYIYGTLNVEGGEVEATGGEAGSTSSGIRMCKRGSEAPELTVAGGKLTATGGDGGSSYGISVYTGTVPNVTLKSGTLIAKGTGENGKAFAEGAAPEDDISEDYTDYWLITSDDGSYKRVSRGESYYTDTEETTGWSYAKLTTDKKELPAKKVQYVDVDGTVKEVAATKINSDSTSGGSGKRWTAGWYYVEGTAEFTGGEINVSGDVNLILCDGAKLESKYSTGLYGINLDNNARLTIYGQSAQTGTLTALIEVEESQTGSLTINGGVVNAKGEDSSGIYSFSGTINLTLNRGTLIATKGESPYPNLGAINVKNLNLTLPGTYYWRTAASRNYTKYEGTTGAYTNGNAAYVELTTQPNGGGYLSYKNWDADNNKLVDDAKTTSECGSVPTDPTTTTEDTDLTWGTAGNTTWYYVSGNVSISQMVKIRGDVHLILCDGAKLTVTANDSLSSGIDISRYDGTTGSLTIYGQSAQTGALESTADKFHGIQIIGGSSLTINGGHVTGTSKDTDSNNRYGIHVGNDNSKLEVNSGTLIAKNTNNKSVAMKIEPYNAGNPPAALPTPAGTLNLPTTYWWRTSDAENTKYQTQAAYDDSALGGTYFELTTTQPADELLDSVEYQKWDGKKLVKAERKDAIPVTSSTTELKPGTGETEKWYYVDQNVTISGTLKITGDVHLILADDAELMVKGGIKVGWGSGSGGTSNTGASLTVYGQTNQTGKLTVSAMSDMASGINVYCSSLTVNGGEVTATGGTSDSGSYGISINGSINDTSLSGSMTVNSGKVTAEGGVSNEADSSGIRLQNGAPTLTINGGEVTATGGKVTNGSSYGIRNDSTMTVTGGEVTATGGKVTNGSSYGIRNDSAMTVTGGEVTATGGTGSSTCGIYNSYAAALTINGGKVIARRASSGSGQSKTVYLFKGAQSTTLNLPGTYWWRTSGAEGTKYKTKAAYTDSTLGGEYFELITTKPADDQIDRVGYLAWNSTTNTLDTTLTERDDAIEVTSDDGQWGESGKSTWYYVRARSGDGGAATYVTIESSGLTVKGNVNLILCDNAEVQLTGSITIEGGASLTIYGQTKQNGVLQCGSGIKVANGGALTVNGGVINASGGYQSSSASVGIWIGYDGRYSKGSMTVNTGKVTATGGTSTVANSIGISVQQSSSLTVNGGEVTATDGTGKSGSYGIYNSGPVTITGGKVIAKSNNCAMMYTGGILNLPLTYWWRASDAASEQYYTQNTRYTKQQLEGKYFEVTTTAPGNVAPDAPISYQDQDGSSGTTGSYIVINPGTGDANGDVTLTGGTSSTPAWYVVKENVTIDGTLTIADGSNVRLILCNGATLTVNEGVVIGEGGAAASDNSYLTIYGQAPESGKAPGKLVANGGVNSGFSAGIKINSYGALTINGGEIEATGADNEDNTPVAASYGIHGTYLYINGGKVTAKGGTAVGILPNGSGSAESGGINVWEMTVTDGTVMAEGGTATGKEGKEGADQSFGIRANTALTVEGGEVSGTGGEADAASYGFYTNGVMLVNGGKVTGKGGKATEGSIGIHALYALSINDKTSAIRFFGSDDEEESGSTSAIPEVTGIGGTVTGRDGSSAGIETVALSVDGVNIVLAFNRVLDESGSAADGTDTDTASTSSAKVTATGGSAEKGTSYGVIAYCTMHIGLGLEDIEGMIDMSGGEADGKSLLDEGETGTDEAGTASTGSTAEINVSGDTAGIMSTDLLSNMLGLPAVWLNGGTMTAIGKVSGIDVKSIGNIEGLGLDTLGLDALGLDTYDDGQGTGTAPSATIVYVQKGTLIADATSGTGGSALALGQRTSDTSPLRCPNAYWWRTMKLGAYTPFPGAAYIYSSDNTYVEITSSKPNGEIVNPDGAGSQNPPHGHTKRQNTVAVIPTPGKTDVTSPETFDAGIAVYAVMSAVSAAASAAWIGKRKKR